MKSKKNILKIIDIIFWTIIIVNAIIEILKSSIIGEIKNDMTMINSLGEKAYLYMMIIIVCIIFFQIIFSLLKMFYLTVLYIGVKIAYKKYYKEKLDKNDMRHNGYYREIISKYSPGVLSYIDDFKLEEKDIVATLMSLELKKKIKIAEKIELIDDNEKGLEENEKYILDCIKNSKLKDINLRTFEKKVIDDCIKDNLLKEKKDIKKEIIKKVLICIFLYAIVRIVFYCLPNLFNKILVGNDGIIVFLLMIVMTIIFFAMAIFPFTTATYIRTYYFMNKLNPYVRNKEAKDINIKLEGLRHYMKEYSLLEQKEHKELALWEDYLIYSVLLGQNTEIVDEIMKKLE